ncbi:hypothetical protein HA402_007828 [Bradysia odoriphaga]|nr:hypothetical protein HA402_007828 [Bradysia odoriphaga]
MCAGNWINRPSITYTPVPKPNRSRVSIWRYSFFKQIIPRVFLANWDIKITDDSFLNVFKTEQIVYLTSDSDNVLTKLDSNHVYIIGGLFDHNHHKGISLRRAQERGLRTARLPLNEEIIYARNSFSVLKVSQGQSWQDALIEVLPSRKGAK